MFYISENKSSEEGSSNPFNMYQSFLEIFCFGLSLLLWSYRNFFTEILTELPLKLFRNPALQKVSVSSFSFSSRFSVQDPTYSLSCARSLFFHRRRPFLCFFGISLIKVVVFWQIPVTAPSPQQVFRQLFFQQVFLPSLYFFLSSRFRVSALGLIIFFRSQSVLCTQGSCRHSFWC
ncbi:hypothetical protein CIPAW_11G151200 [Carya illinoinensis]|uniref:Transmembrane protein n=1 Tax=Carya illinoinensis TaxID=32201 RepID=A0A8T1P5A6_CARIL|nr:hypothetical protein CIPAW_11G151200 [Carya illinoinensis]